MENLITGGTVLDSLIQIFLSFLIVYSIYKTDRIREMFLLPLISLLIDSDHLLITYTEGIKAFHSIFFISLISLPFLAYGFARSNRKFESLGVTIYVVALFNVSWDLLEGGKISFLYPFSSQAYILDLSGADAAASRMALMLFMGFFLGTAYIFSRYLEWESRTGFRGAPHTGHAS